MRYFRVNDLYGVITEEPVLDVAESRIRRGYGWNIAVQVQTINDTQGKLVNQNVIAAACILLLKKGYSIERYEQSLTLER